MNLQNIFNHIESEDPEFYERTSPRRAALRTFMKGAALTAVPFALGGLFKKAYGQTANSVTDILNFALALEYLEAEFYARALANAPALGLTGTALAAFQTIGRHETAHVAFLKTTITNAGGIPIAKPSFDFTGGVGTPAGAGMGPFQTVFSNYGVFLAVAQLFEDTGVRAYKGQVSQLTDDSYNNILQAALQIHSVEARHAAHVRLMRANRNSATNSDTIRPWVTQDQTTIMLGDPVPPDMVQQVYDGEQLTFQEGIDIAAFVNADRATEAFDEPLSMNDVLAIVAPFLLP